MVLLQHHGEIGIFDFGKSKVEGGACFLAGFGAVSYLGTNHSITRALQGSAKLTTYHSGSTGNKHSIIVGGSHLLLCFSSGLAVFGVC